MLAGAGKRWWCLLAGFVVVVVVVAAERAKIRHRTHDKTHRREDEDARWGDGRRWC